MLICPECHQENIANNKFCKKCGTSLTHKNCYQCGERVSFEQQNCPQCGAWVIDSYLCIITQPKNQALSLPSFREKSATKQSYIDSNLRYGVLDSESCPNLSPFSIADDSKFYAVEVIDFKPLQKSTLDTILETVEGLEPENLLQSGIPAIALPYLTLTDFCPAVPKLIDAWINSETKQQFVIISPRKRRQLWVEFLANPELSLTQVFTYLDHTAKLWQELARVNYGQTLLEEDNLGVDSENSVVIRQLYPDKSTSPSKLADFLQNWLVLLEKAGRSEARFLLELLDLVKEQKINSIRELREQIQVFLEETQLNSLLQQEGKDEQATSMNNDTEEIDEHLPMSLLQISDAGCSDVGCERSHNEDCFAIATKIDKQETPQGIKYQGRAIYIVCDGMGGHAAGEIASAMAVKTLYHYFQKHWQDQLPDQDVIKEGIWLANQNIYNANLEKGNIGSQRMGTTLVLALVEGTKLVIAHVGDSRIYQVTRTGGLEQLTVDHSVAQAEIKNGVQPELAFSRPDAYQLTQALGPRDNDFVHPEIKFMDIQEDLLLLLCTDGLCDNNLLENNWQDCLSPLISSQANLDQGLAQLIDLGNQINGHDNITAVVSQIKVQPNLESPSS
jgi:protein phosphatase